MQLSGQLSSKGHARLKAIVAATFPVHSGGGGGAAAAAAIDDDDDDAKVDTDTKVKIDTKVLQQLNEWKHDDEWDDSPSWGGTYREKDDEVHKRICITKAKDYGHWVRDRVQAVLSHPPNKGDLRCVV